MKIALSKLFGGNAQSKNGPDWGIPLEIKKYLCITFLKFLAIFFNKINLLQAFTFENLYFFYILILLKPNQNKKGQKN